MLRDVSGDLNVRVKAVQKTRSGGIAIETVSKKELKECVRFAEVGLKMEEPRKIGPKLIVYDVPNVLTNEEFLTDLFSKNLRECVGESVFKERVRVILRSSKKDAACGNVIVEVPVCVRDRLCMKGHVFIK